MNSCISAKSVLWTRVFQHSSYYELVYFSKVHTMNSNISSAKFIRWTRVFSKVLTMNSNIQQRARLPWPNSLERCEPPIAILFWEAVHGLKPFEAHEVTARGNDGQKVFLHNLTFNSSSSTWQKCAFLFVSFVLHQLVSWEALTGTQVQEVVERKPEATLSPTERFCLKGPWTRKYRGFCRLE